MTWILIGLAVGALIGGGYWAQQRAQQARVGGPKAKKLEVKTQAMKLADDERRILDLQPNDIVEYYDDTMIVESTLLYDEEGSVWQVHLLSGADDGQDRWLVVDDDDRIRLGFFEVLPSGSVDVPFPPPKSFTVGAITFSLDDRGSARVRKRDAKGTRDLGKCKFADYKGPAGELLAVEWWGETAEVAIGKGIDEDDIMILPGS